MPPKTEFSGEIKSNQPLLIKTTILCFLALKYHLNSSASQLKFKKHVIYRKIILRNPPEKSLLQSSFEIPFSGGVLKVVSKLSWILKCLRRSKIALNLGAVTHNC